MRKKLTGTAALLILIVFSSFAFAPGRQGGFRELFRRSPETRAQVVNHGQWKTNWAWIKFRLKKPYRLI